MFLLLLLAAIGVAIFFGITAINGNSNAGSDIPTATARITTLVDKVVEQGSIESQSTVSGVCQINNENKIIFLTPEGSLVKKDEVVVKFDDSAIKKEITDAETNVNKAKSEVETSQQDLKVQEDENVIAMRKAKQTLKFAKLDLKKYMEGDYIVKKSEIEQAISEAQTAVDKANRDMENTRALVKRGFREYQQLEEAGQVVKSANLSLVNAKRKLLTLEDFEHVKSEQEYGDKAIDAEQELAIAETTATAKLAKARDQLRNLESGLKIWKDRLDELKKNLAKHTIKAPQAGTFTYARDDWRGNGEKLHEGSTVYRNQTVFILPDMKRMQVKVGIHETLVSKVAEGQKATIKVDAFSGLALTGVVKSVSQMSASTRWERSNNYHVIVTIDSFPEDIRLKPGMNAEVEIMVGKYDDRLAVPIQSVTSFGQKKYVFAENEDNQFVAQEVETEETTVSFVAITSGLEDGDVVALDAYQRGLSEFDTNDTEKMLKMELEDMGKATEGQVADEIEDSAAEKMGQTSEESGKSDEPAESEEPAESQDEAAQHATETTEADSKSTEADSAADETEKVNDADKSDQSIADDTDTVSEDSDSKSDEAQSEPSEQTQLNSPAEQPKPQPPLGQILLEAPVHA